MNPARAAAVVVVTMMVMMGMIPAAAVVAAVHLFVGRRVVVHARDGLETWSSWHSRLRRRHATMPRVNNSNKNNNNNCGAFWDRTG